MTIKKGQRISISTEFKSGIAPVNKLPVGSITIHTHKKDFPRHWIKISEPNQWIPYAEFVWVQYGGTVPEGFIIHHVDEDTLHDDIENLSLITRATHITIHRKKLQAGIPINYTLGTKTVVCSKCGKSYLAKVQRRNSVCSECLNQKTQKTRREYRRQVAQERINDAH